MENECYDDMYGADDDESSRETEYKSENSSSDQ